MRPPKPADRKTRILDAAERAFAEDGFAGASLRRIVLDAQVNLATVYYYFASKDGLMAAVFERRFGPLREEHLDLLERRKRAAQGRALPVEQILDTMLIPPLRLAGNASARNKAVLRLIGRMVTDPNPQTQDLLRHQHERVRAGFLAELHRSLPDLPEPDLQWRFEFFWGAVAFILCNPGKIEKATKGLCNPADPRLVLAQMKTCFAAGFRAPAASTRECLDPLSADGSAAD